MEFILKKKTCRDFLNNYHKEIHPILLPKIIEIGILTLKLSFNKDLFSPDELNDIIISLKQQYNLQKGKKSFTNLKNKNFKNLTEENSINNNKDIFYNTIETSNFYDSNYIIPETIISKYNSYYDSYSTSV